MIKGHMTLWKEAPLHYHCAKFDASRSCESGDITILFCQTTSSDHMVKAIYDLVSWSASS